MERPLQATKLEASITPVCTPAKKHYARSEGGESQDTADAIWRRREPLYYNPLQDKGNRNYLKAPAVMHHLVKQGLVTNVRYS